jgi:hypothetical protein
MTSLKIDCTRCIGIIGGASCDSRIAELAEETGFLIGSRGYSMVCGGLGGVMEAASRGVKRGGGVTIGILPGESTFDANRYIDIPIATGLGHGRNLIIVRTARVLVAIDGKYGTLSEIAFALQYGKPVIGLETWNPDGSITEVKSPQEVIQRIKAILS